MKAEDVRAKSPDELRDALVQLKKEQFNLRFQAANGQLENTSRVREVRRDIARVRTILAERALKGELGQPMVAAKSDKRPGRARRLLARLRGAK